jgi:hypothetical protein
MLRKTALIVCCALLVSGCKRELSNKQTVPVKGKVVFANGEPVRWAHIDLLTTDLTVGVNASGSTGDDGTLQIRTYSNKDYDGAVPGTYKVSIEAYNQVVMGTLPPNANSPSTVPPGSDKDVTVEIKPDGNDLVITLKN